MLSQWTDCTKTFVVYQILYRTGLGDLHETNPLLHSNVKPSAEHVCYSNTNIIPTACNHVYEIHKPLVHA